MGASHLKTREGNKKNRLPGKDLPRDRLSFFKWWRARRLPEIQSPQRQHIKNPLFTMP